MVKFVLLLVFELFVFDLRKSFATKPNFSQLVKRVETQGMKSLVPVEEAFVNSFCNSLWTNRCYTKPGKLMGAEAPHTEFQHMLGERILKKPLTVSEKLFICDTAEAFCRDKLTSLEVRTLESKGSWKKAAISRANSEIGNYVKGHFSPLEGRAYFNQVFLTLYAKNEVDGLARKSLQWLCPIEQAFYCKTLGDYRRMLAILKGWNAYTDFALVVIPKGAKFSSKIGLASHQTFPYTPRNTRDFVVSDQHPTRQIEIEIASISDVKQDKIYEYVDGGGIQFYTTYRSRTMNVR